MLAKVRLISVPWKFSELNTLITSTDTYVIRNQNLFPTNTLKKTEIIHVTDHYISNEKDSFICLIMGGGYERDSECNHILSISFYFERISLLFC